MRGRLAPLPSHWFVVGERIPPCCVGERFSPPARSVTRGSQSERPFLKFQHPGMKKMDFTYTAGLGAVRRGHVNPVICFLRGMLHTVGSSGSHCCLLLCWWWWWVHRVHVRRSERELAAPQWTQQKTNSSGVMVMMRVPVPDGAGSGDDGDDDEEGRMA